MDTKKEGKHLFARIDHISLDVIHSSPENTEHFLTEEGLSHAEELAFGLQHIKKLQFIARAKQNQEKDEALMQRAFLALKHTFEENVTKAGDVLVGLLKDRGAAFQFRNLDKWTDIEIREVLNEIDLVSLLEQLDKPSDECP